jgi:hypothetical protein
MMSGKNLPKRGSSVLAKKKKNSPPPGRNIIVSITYNITDSNSHFVAIIFADEEAAMVTVFDMSQVTLDVLQPTRYRPVATLLTAAERNSWDPKKHPHKEGCVHCVGL